MSSNDKHAGVEKDVTTDMHQSELLRLWEDKSEALMYCRLREDELAAADLPAQFLIPVKIRLIRKSVAIVVELRRIAAQEFLNNVTSFPREPAQEKTALKDPENIGTGRNGDRRTMLIGLSYHAWSAMQFCRTTEEELAHIGILSSRLVRFTWQLARSLLAVFSELQRGDAQEFLEQHIVKQKRFSSAVSSAVSREALNGILRQFSARDRKVLREMLDRSASAPDP
jgi:hypothetical protein